MKAFKTTEIVEIKIGDRFLYVLHNNPAEVFILVHKGLALEVQPQRYSCVVQVSIRHPNERVLSNAPFEFSVYNRTAYQILEQINTIINN